MFSCEQVPKLCIINAIIILLYFVNRVKRPEKNVKYRRRTRRPATEQRGKSFFIFPVLSMHLTGSPSAYRRPHTGKESNVY